MALLEELSPVLAGRFLWPVRGDPPASEAESDLRYVFDSDRSSESILLCTKFDEGLLFRHGQVLLASRFVFERSSSACTMLKGSTRDITVVRQGTVRL